MHMIFGIRWPILLGVLLLLLFVIVIIQPQSVDNERVTDNVSQSTDTVANPASEDSTKSVETTAAKVIDTAETQDTSTETIYDEGIVSTAKPTSVDENLIEVGGGYDTPIIVQNEQAELSPEQQAYREALDVLRDNPSLSPVWKITRSIGNLGEPPKTEIE